MDWLWLYQFGQFKVASCHKLEYNGEHASKIISARLCDECQYLSQLLDQILILLTGQVQHLIAIVESDKLD